MREQLVPRWQHLCWASSSYPWLFPEAKEQSYDQGQKTIRGWTSGWTGSTWIIPRNVTVQAGVPGSGHRNSSNGSSDDICGSRAHRDCQALC